MAKRRSIRPKSGKPRSHTSARPEPVINSPATVERRGQAGLGHEAHKEIRAQRKRNFPRALPLVAVLSEIRLQLLVAMAASAVCSAALKAQRADSDDDVAVLLQRCIADELNRQIERLDVVIARHTP